MPFRRKLTKEEREEREAMLANAPRSTVVREGRKFTVLQLPDRYGENGPVGGTGDITTKLDSLVDDE